MDIREVFTFIQHPTQSPPDPGVLSGGQENFHLKPPSNDQTLKAGPDGGTAAIPNIPPPDRIDFKSRAAPRDPPFITHSAKAAAGAYEKQHSGVTPSHLQSAIAKYWDDQLLSSPGGDHYDLKNKRYIADPLEQHSFWGRIGKNINDAFGNLKNFAGNLLFGADRHYRDENGAIQEAQRRGLIGSVADFLQDLGSAFSFGAWRPDGEEEPKGLGRRLGFFFSKLKEAVFGDLVQGVAGSVVNMAKDLVFAGWNLLETVPDATIGNFEAGRKVTTGVFDNGQVALNYIADILPGGDASIRVHSPDLKNLKPPVLNNLSMPESNTDDTRWKYVRNTPFRKAIETVGSLLTSILTFRFLGNFRLSGEKRNHPE